MKKMVFVFLLIIINGILFTNVAKGFKEDNEYVKKQLLNLSNFNNEINESRTTPYFDNKGNIYFIYKNSNYIEIFNNSNTSKIKVELNEKKLKTEGLYNYTVDKNGFIIFYPKKAKESVVIYDEKGNEIFNKTLNYFFSDAPGFDGDSLFDKKTGKVFFGNIKNNKTVDESTQIKVIKDKNSFPIKLLNNKNRKEYLMEDIKSFKFYRILDQDKDENIYALYMTKPKYVGNKLTGSFDAQTAIVKFNKELVPLAFFENARRVDTKDGHIYEIEEKNNRIIVNCWEKKWLISNRYVNICSFLRFVI